MTLNMENTEKDKKQIRCAIYTRVSTSEGLNQEFTSLDNQRESGESYIQSQKSEGWIALPENYDDAGFTGANTDRPALQKLITDTKDRKIDCIVVYKVDRLSRSLLDFSRLLESFDQHGVNFVSVTQQFNTNTSMGRLTLNILLSFAQFEREITSERTRDKMAAAKKRGKWVGGCTPLGYRFDKETHKLVIIPQEAEIIKDLFDLYLKRKSILEVVKIANENGHRTKIRKLASEKHSGGIKFTTNAVERLLRNSLYIGKVKYQGVIYDGEQEGFIDEKIFLKVQELLRTNMQKPKTRAPIGKKTALLTKILRCKACNSSMYFTHTVKHKKLHYYHYVCLNAQKRGYQECPTRLVNANLMDKKVMECIRKLSDDVRIKPENWDKLALEEQRTIFNELVKSVAYDGQTEILDIFLQKKQISHQFKVSKLELKYHRVSLKEKEIQSEPQLRQNLLLAHQIQLVLDQRKAQSLKQVSEWLNISQQRLYQIFNLLFLSPRIQEEILLRNNPGLFEIPEYKLRPIMDEIDWDKQHEMWQKLLQSLSSSLS